MSIFQPNTLAGTVSSKRIRKCDDQNGPSEYALGRPMLTPSYNRVRERHWCASCFDAKNPGLLLCYPCHRRMKARHTGTYDRIMEKRLRDLDLYLFDHNDRQAISWLGGA